MGSFDFTMVCARCPTTLFSLSGDGRAWKNDANSEGGHSAVCPSCGSEFVTEDDGIDPSTGGGVQRKDVSRPKITGLGATASGPIAGGTTVRVNGDAFLVPSGTPVVKFDGVAGTGVNVLNDDALDATTPAGKLLLNVAAGPYTKLVHGTVTGGFTAGETITGGDSAETATVEEVDAGYLLISAQSGAFTASETLTGADSAATADYTSVEGLPFQVSETVTGVSSGSTGTVEQLYPLKVSSPSAAFTADEHVTGGTSLARAKLATTPSDGSVTVSIENSYGQRPVNFELAAAFEYTV